VGRAAGWDAASSAARLQKVLLLASGFRANSALRQRPATLKRLNEMKWSNIFKLIFHMFRCLDAGFVGARPMQDLTDDCKHRIVLIYNYPCVCRMLVVLQAVFIKFCLCQVGENKICSTTLCRICLFFHRHQ
jgi:hypothetical protein